jgi:hypothetical protein
MLKKTFYFILILLLIDLFSIGCTCRNLKDYPKHCKGNFTDAFSKVLINGSEIAKDSFVVVAFDAFVLQNGLLGESFNCVRNNATIPNGFLLQQALACKLAITNLTNMEDSVISINVTTVKNYNANYVAGSNINAIVKHTFTNNAGAPFTNLTNTQLLSQYNQNCNNIQDFVRLRHQSILQEKPTNSADTMQLAVEYILSNNLILRDTSSLFLLHF